jgi:hypothetical protein
VTCTHSRLDCTKCRPGPKPDQYLGLVIQLPRLLRPSSHCRSLPLIYNTITMPRHSNSARRSAAQLRMQADIETRIRREHGPVAGRTRSKALRGNHFEMGVSGSLCLQRGSKLIVSSSLDACDYGCTNVLYNTDSATSMLSHEHWRQGK